MISKRLLWYLSPIAVLLIWAGTSYLTGDQSSQEYGYFLFVYSSIFTITVLLLLSKLFLKLCIFLELIRNNRTYQLFLFVIGLGLFIGAGHTLRCVFFVRDDAGVCDGIGGPALTWTGASIVFTFLYLSRLSSSLRKKISNKQIPHSDQVKLNHD